MKKKSLRLIKNTIAVIRYEKRKPFFSHCSAFAFIVMQFTYQEEFQIINKSRGTLFKTETCIVLFFFSENTFRLENNTTILTKLLQIQLII